MDEVDPVKDREEFEKHRVRFFALIGHCVTIYQSVEDHLEAVFAAGLAGSEAKARAIFRVARGLEAKLSLISAALSEESAEKQERWLELLPRVAAAFESRNQIAHANPVHHAGGVTIMMSDDPAVPSRAIQTGSSRMELRKPTKKGEVIWTEALMRSEYQKMSDLFGFLVGFSLQLKDKPVPDHLREW